MVIVMVDRLLYSCKVRDYDSDVDLSNPCITIEANCSLA